jgi:flavorubredoxin
MQEKMEKRQDYMKINIIYESHFGNGKEIINELSDILKSKNQDVALFSVKETSPEDPPLADLYIFSAPTRKFTLPPDIGFFIDHFKPHKKNIRYALVTTYLDPRTIALKKMTAKLNEKELKKAANDFKVRVSGLKGPIKEKYRDRLVLFAEDLLKEPIL